MRVVVCLSMMMILSPLLTTAFVVVVSPSHRFSTKLGEAAKEVEVCGSKDCKRGGGGPRLEKLIGEVSRLKYRE